MLMLAFTVFWAYVTFSQYFLIWNANVPEETFWYNLREVNHDGSTNQWWYVGIYGILFGHFFIPFFALLSYRYKVTHAHHPPDRALDARDHPDRHVLQHPAGAEG